METISRHELVPFTALMNMIKFNYLEKKEVFQTLLGILSDYDPTDEENRKRVYFFIIPTLLTYIFWSRISSTCRAHRHI